MKHLAFAISMFVSSSIPAMASDFRVLPYLLKPAADGMTIRWLSETAEPGSVIIDDRLLTSSPVLATALEYQEAEPATARFDGLPWLHSVRVDGLAANAQYPYSVAQGLTTSSGIFHTPLPASMTTSGLTPGSGVRLFVYADSETEPESIGKRAIWAAPAGSTRPDWVVGRYLATETEGYLQNLNIMSDRSAQARSAGKASLIAIAGDLVESGGEQRDWDEFWRHNAGPLGSIASNVPIVAAFGNHENYGGPGALGGYSAAAAQSAAAKFQTYFEAPPNGASNPSHEGRYHRVDFGPVTLLTLDSSNGGVQGTESDTNFFLDNALNPQIPDYMPGSEQYVWLETQLASAQAAGRITFVQFHHAPYSVGPHGWPPESASTSGQSGRPMRVLTPLFEQYGVAAVFSGHDEMYERSLVNGIHFYDIGIGGDGLRGPVDGLTNDFQVYLAHSDAPELWEADVLVSGGKHYGHLEIDVVVNTDGFWETTISPVYAFPLLSSINPGEILGWERRVYSDVVTFVTVPEPSSAGLAVVVGAVLAGQRLRRAQLQRMNGSRVA